VVEPGGGERVVDRPTHSVVVKATHELVDVAELDWGAGRPGPSLHVHRQHTDAFYVLEGEPVFTVGPERERVHAGPGTFVGVPPLVAHTFANESDADVRFLNVHSPASGFVASLRAGERLRDQHDPPADGGRPLADAVIRRPGDADYVADPPGLTVSLISDTDALGISLSRTEAGSPPAPPHFHRRHVEWFFVLEGAMTFWLDGREHDATAGSFVFVPPGTVHHFAFPGDGTTAFLTAHTPSCGFGDFVRGLHEAKTDDDLRAVRERFDQVAA
jgi:mannose-6-phosphate isomerase-like protein (cupin superfamily)